MSPDETQFQSPQDRRRASKLSQQPTQPPTVVPGYEPQRFIGRGAYGEVWVATDKNTGRQVAIKFFAHRTSVDWPMLSREVEKLVVLSADRYIVQLLDVGWNADPPYYVMEYIENGSLEDRLGENGKLPPDEAVRLFKEIAIGLSHAHGKGVLHCDLKPANVLLDQDSMPRLGDFGQSRLTDEQSPSLGTLFYMAPEQADLEAVPDARWDVYALGAVLYRMLTGYPPYRSAEAVSEIDSTPALPERLRKYREFIQSQTPVTNHRKIPGVDKRLAKIVDRCLAADPANRFRNVAEVLDALKKRDDAAVRRPLYVLGVIGPLMLMLTIGIFGYRLYQRAMDSAKSVAVATTKEASRFAAEGEARNVANDLEKRFVTIIDHCTMSTYKAALIEFLEETETQDQLAVLDDPTLHPDETENIKSAFRASLLRKPLQERMNEIIKDPRLPPVASWFVTNKRGTMLAAAFDVAPNNSPIGSNYAYRSYFHGGLVDLPKGTRDLTPLQEAKLSAPFSSTATNTYKVAISAPIQDNGRTIGVLAMTFELGDFVKFPQSPDQCAVLIDARDNDHHGMILQHPLYGRLRREHSKLPFDISENKYRVDVDAWQSNDDTLREDPLSRNEFGDEYLGKWIVGTAPVVFDVIDGAGRRLRAGDTNLVLAVDQRLSSTVEPVSQLGRTMYTEAMIAVAVVVIVSMIVLFLVLRMLSR